MQSVIGRAWSALTRRDRRALYLLIGADVIIGVVLRVVVYRSSIGRLEGDEATWGLMAVRARHGQITHFLLVAALRRHAGGHPRRRALPALRHPSLPDAAGTDRAHGGERLCDLAHRQADDRRAAGARRGAAPLGLAAVPDLEAADLARVLRQRAALQRRSSCCSHCGLSKSPTRRDVAVLGLVLGLAFWQTLQIVTIIVPALLWLTVRRPSVWRFAWAGRAGAGDRRAPVAALESPPRLVVVHLPAAAGRSLLDEAPRIPDGHVPDDPRTAGAVLDPLADREDLHVPRLPRADRALRDRRPGGGGGRRCRCSSS